MEILSKIVIDLPMMTGIVKGRDAGIEDDGFSGSKPSSVSIVYTTERWQEKSSFEWLLFLLHHVVTCCMKTAEAWVESEQRDRSSIYDTSAADWGALSTNIRYHGGGAGVYLLAFLWSNKVGNHWWDSHSSSTCWSGYQRISPEHYNIRIHATCEPSS